ncbi:GNAT family N-acetyltransferase [Haloarchaeobius amylolyticus]|uniref:GNAT family N-acetyltransferase n=1 Tax=Haloarchaeobius amylolyticus TaxID=1198296 RepID=UPI0022703676|nr:GNAT family N-acetyltransferase [Haloarchaeobius amylolyticus]
MPDYRPLSEEDRETFHAYTSYAFRPHEEPDEFDPEEDHWDLGANRAIYDGDEPLAVCRHYWFETTWRGVDIELPGLSAVASPPEHRHGGNVRQLLLDSLQEYRERGDPLSALWPFKYAFYHKYGWDTTNHRGELEFDPAVLEPIVADLDDEGSFRRLDGGDWEAVDAVHRELTAGEDFAIRRSEGWWRHRWFEGWDQDPYVYGWERDGEIAGYVNYKVEDGDDGRTFAAWELGAVDHEAYLHCLRFIYSHDSQVSTVTLHTGTDALLLDLVDDPQNVTVTEKTGPMVRVVDVVDALETMPYPSELETGLVLAVEDSLADWNDDRFELTVEDGEGTCTPTDASPDVTLDIAALSQLVIGYAPLSRLLKTADIEADEHVREDLAALFPPRNVFLRDFF